MAGAHRPSSPRLLEEVVLFGVLDLAGMLMLALGVAYLVQGPGIFFDDFPSSPAESWALTFGGFAAMAYAGWRMLRVLRSAQRDISR